MPSAIGMKPQYLLRRRGKFFVEQFTLMSKGFSHSIASVESQTFSTTTSPPKSPSEDHHEAGDGHHDEDKSDNGSGSGSSDGDVTTDSTSAAFTTSTPFTEFGIVDTARGESGSNDGGFTTFSRTGSSSNALIAFTPTGSRSVNMGLFFALIAAFAAATAMAVVRLRRGPVVAAKSKEEGNVHPLKAAVKKRMNFFALLAKHHENRPPRKNEESTTYELFNDNQSDN